MTGFCTIVGLLVTPADSAFEWRVNLGLVIGRCAGGLTFRCCGGFSERIGLVALGLIGGLRERGLFVRGVRIAFGLPWRGLEGRTRRGLDGEACLILVEILSPLFSTLENFACPQSTGSLIPSPCTSDISEFLVTGFMLSAEPSGPFSIIGE